MNQRPSNKKDFIELTVYSAIEIWHVTCGAKGGRISYQNGDYHCSGCTSTWKNTWILARATDKDISDRFLTVSVDQDIYRLEEVINGKLRYSTLVKVLPKNTTTIEQQLDLIFDKYSV